MSEEPTPAPTPEPSPAPDPAPTPTGFDEAPPSVFGEGLNFREGWFNDFADSEELAPYLTSLPKYTSLPGLIKSAEDSRRQLSQRMDGMVKVPGADATPEEVAAWRSANGIPENLEEFKIDVPSDLPGGLNIEPGQLDAFREFAHREGLSPAMASKLVAFQAQAEAQAVAEINAARDAEEAALQNKWGPNWERNNMKVDGAIGLAGGDLEHPALQHPAVRAVIKELVDRGGFEEDSFVHAENRGATLSPGAEARAILNDPNHHLHAAYWNRDGKHTKEQQDAAIAAYQKLTKQQVELERR